MEAAWYACPGVLPDGADTETFSFRLLSPDHPKEALEVTEQFSWLTPVAQGGNELAVSGKPIVGVLGPALPLPARDPGTGLVGDTMVEHPGCRRLVTDGACCGDDQSIV